jgi:hypothetical protein
VAALISRLDVEAIARTKASASGSPSSNPTIAELSIKGSGFIVSDDFVGTAMVANRQAGDLLLDSPNAAAETLDFGRSRRRCRRLQKRYFDLVFAGRQIGRVPLKRSVRCHPNARLRRQHQSSP